MFGISLFFGPVALFYGHGWGESDLFSIYFRNGISFHYFYVEASFFFHGASGQFYMNSFRY